MKSTMSSNRNEGPRFTDSEKVLCFHGALIYEAKILKVHMQPHKEPHYLLHYAGWSKKWDELVPEMRVLKLNDENLKRQKDQEAAVTAGGRKGLRLSAGGRAGASNGSKKGTSIAGESVSTFFSHAADSPLPPMSIQEDDEPFRKIAKVKSVAFEGDTTSSSVTDAKIRRFEVFVETETKYLRKMEINLQIPERLRMILADDFDFVVRQKKLQILPARCSVKKLLSDYVQFLKDSQSKVSQTELDYVWGMQDYFDLLLKNQGLYKYERTQHMNMLSFERTNADDEGKLPSMSKIYGPVHFLRVISKLGTLLAYTTMEQLDVLLLRRFTDDLLDFISKRHDEYFNTADYLLVHPDYYRESEV